MIPQIIHYCYLGPNPPRPIELECCASVRRHHPDWDIRLLADTSESIACSLRNIGMSNGGTPEELMNNQDVRSLQLPLKSFYDRLQNYSGPTSCWAVRTDLLRLCLLYAFGGWTLDVDFYCFQSLTKFETEEMVLAQIRPSKLAVGVMATHPRNEHIAELLRRLLTQNPESDSVSMSLWGYAEDEGLKSWPATFFIPHERHAPAERIYDHSIDTHLVHCWREHQYNAAILAKIAEKVFTQDRKGCGCYRKGLPVECGNSSKGDNS